ncbi:MAG: secondary thiamine-phosphate synthase enzyme YjbQ [Halanaerobiales bacterium]
MVKKINIHTNNRTEFIDITKEVRQMVKESGISDGIITIFIPHSTAAVTINENADPDVVRDIIMEINKVIPFLDSYKHFEGNSAAHIKSSLFGVSESVIVADGELLLGTWQGIYFCEFDGPRNRKFFVKISAG